MFHNTLKKVLIVGLTMMMGSYALAQCKASFVLIQDNWCSDGSARFYTTKVPGADRYNWTFTLDGKTAKYTTRTNVADLSAGSFGPGYDWDARSLKIRIDTTCYGGTSSGSYTKYYTLGGSCIRKKGADNQLAASQDVIVADYLSQLNHVSLGKTQFLTGEQGSKLLVNSSDQEQTYVLVEKWDDGQMISGEFTLSPGESYAFEVQDQEMFLFGEGDVIAQDK